MHRRLVMTFAGASVLALAATAWAGGKNLQHYSKDMSMEDLKAEMKVLKSSLGVGCDHCHQMKPKRDWAVDVDNKKIARSMLDMTDKLNKDCFTRDFLGIKEGEVPKATCFMCHKGKEKPEMKPAKEDANKKFEEACKDAKNKDMAAAMKKLVDKINKDYFTWKDAPKATCWMCHRGNEEPEKRPFSKDLPEGFAKRHADKLDQPVEKVFHDLRILNGMNVRTFGQIMGWFSRELGVKCTHCHQETDFAADTPKKTRARQMLEMTGYLGDGRYYPKGNSPVGCGTCHQGNAVPQRTPGEKS